MSVRSVGVEEEFLLVEPGTQRPSSPSGFWTHETRKRGNQIANATVRLAIIGGTENPPGWRALTCQRHGQNRGH